MSKGSYEYADIFIEDWHEKQYPKSLFDLKKFYAKNRIFIDKAAQKQITNIINQVEGIFDKKRYKENIITNANQELKQPENGL